MAQNRNAVPAGGLVAASDAPNVAFDFFVEAYGVKWDAFAEMVKDRDALLSFNDYPAEH